jgi:DNA-binding GntR family transcriptional regulator
MKSLIEKTFHGIRHQITCGKLYPGERLIEEIVCKEFKASRSFLREAFHQLEVEGSITFERNKGLTVSKWSEPLRLHKK